MQSRHVRLAALLVLLAVLGTASVRAADPATHVGGVWPVGLAAGILVFATRPPQPYAAPLIGLVAFGTFVVGGYPLGVAAGYAVAITAEALVTRQVLTRDRETQQFSDDLDLVRYLLATFLGALTGALLLGLTSAVADFGVAWEVALTALAAHLASQLTLLAFFMDDVHVPGTSGPGERVLRWTLAVVVTTAAFVPTSLPTLVFLVLPMVAWTSLRASMREALWNLVVIATIASTFTFLGRGPLTGMDGGDVPPELVPLPFATFLVACALVGIPFAMVVRRQRFGAAEVASERARFQRIVASATGMAIIETDDIGRIRLFNPGAEAMLGYTEEELLGRFPDLFHTEEEIRRQAGLLGVPPDLMHVSLASARPENGPRDWQFVRKDGEVITMSMLMVALTDDNGVVTGYLTTAEDITERVRTQAALESGLETERRAVARLQEVDRTKDAFVSSVSHELRTPITNIVGYLELLIDGAYGETSAPQQEALGRIDLNSHRLLELIDDLLTLSSIESLDVELAREPVDLREVVRRTGEKVQPALHERHQHLDYQVPAEPVVVMGDYAHLERMVANLASNAVKFTPDGGTVTLRVTGGGPGCAIEVQDTGIGIPDDEQAQLFNRFYRATYAQRAAIQGSGLGLSIARSIAELHGARISAESAPGRGSVFRVAFDERARADHRSRR